MDAVEFLKAKEKMCDFEKNKNAGPPTCDGCPLSIMNNGTDQLCAKFVSKFPEKAVEIVEKWKEEHREKTRLSEFLRMFPNADLAYGIPKLCIKVYDKNAKCEDRLCFECKDAYWNTEVTENEDA